MNTYRIHLNTGGTIHVEADDFILKLPDTKSNRLVFFKEEEGEQIYVAIFNWDKIIGFDKLEGGIVLVHT